METVQMTIGGRAVLLTVKQADSVRRMQEKNRARDRQIERELKQERLLPSSPASTIGGWQSDHHYHHVGPDTPHVKTWDEKFQEFLKVEGTCIS
jgi:hypothetical protein